MSELERLTITMPAEILATVKAAVAEGTYASSSEVIQEALREWRVRRSMHQEELTTLKADIRKGLGDVAAGRVGRFHAKPIVERGRQLFAARSSRA